MLESRYDVVIVGAGPAGAAAALAMRGHGLECVIIEKAKLPRYKMCSGILFPSARKLITDGFGPIPKDVLCDISTIFSDHGVRSTRLGFLRDFITRMVSFSSELTSMSLNPL